MPPKQRHRSQERRRDDSDDDAGPSTQQPSQSQRSQSQHFGHEEIERRANDLVQYLLIADQKKVPIKKQDINKHVLKEMSRAFPAVMEKAQRKMKEVFGMDVVEIESKQKSYIIINLLENKTAADDSHLEWPEEDDAKTALLMIILSLIFMNNNIMPDSLLWYTLKRMGLEPDKTHEVFGDVKKVVMTEFVRQGYLDCIRQPNSDPPAFEIKWGQRAIKETTKKNVLEFVSQIYEVESKQWKSQWQDVLRTEGPQEDDEDTMVVD